MNQHHVDDRDAELEALLRATFSSEAQNRLPESRPVPPFPATDRIATVHPIRRRWVGLSVVAAALVAVVVGATVLATETMESQRRAPVPAGTSGGPSSSFVPPAPTVGSTPPTPTAASTASSSPSSASRALTVGGVTMTVPTSWGIQPLDPDEPDYGYPRTCVADGPTATPVTYDPTRCALAVRIGTDPRTSPFDARGYDVPLQAICGAAGHSDAGLVPVSGDQVTIDGQTVEHRTYTSSCLPSSSIETWTVPTWPVVQFLRIGPAADSAAAAAVDAVVTGASLPSPSPVRASEIGYPTAVTGDVVSIDRVTVLGDRQQDTDPTSYDYPIAAGTPIRLDTPTGPDELTPDQFRAEVAGQTVDGVPPIGDLYVYVETDGRDATFVVLRLRSTLI